VCRARETLLVRLYSGALVWLLPFSVVFFTTFVFRRYDACFPSRGRCRSRSVCFHHGPPIASPTPFLFLLLVFTCHVIRPDVVVVFCCCFGGGGVFFFVCVCLFVCVCSALSLAFVSAYFLFFTLSLFLHSFSMHPPPCTHLHYFRCCDKAFPISPSCTSVATRWWRRQRRWRGRRGGSSSILVFFSSPFCLFVLLRFINEQFFFSSPLLISLR
jgi:hypothetical protein